MERRGGHRCFNLVWPKYMPDAGRTSVGRKIALAVCLPIALLALTGLLFVWSRDRGALDQTFARALIGIVVVALLLAAMTVLAVRAFVVRPLRRLASAMARAKDGDVMTRAPVETPDEIGALAETFNAMLARMTDLKAQEIDRSRELELLQREVALKEQLQSQNRIIEETNRELAERVRELTLLFEVTRSLNSTLELDQILKRITEMVGNTLGFREFSTMLYDGALKELEIKAAYGATESDSLIGKRLKLGEGAGGIAAQTKEIVYIEDTRADSRYLRLGDGRDREGSLLCIPMLYKETLVGVLNFSRPGVSAFSQDEIKLLQSVANQASMAIVNARLFQETVELSLTDPLTAVPNRRHLFQQLEMEVHRAQRFGTPTSFVMIDIDHFKLFNDASGHPAGDALLKEVASLIVQSVRKVDTIARYGGEEFAIILPKIRKAEAMEVAEKLRKAVLRTDFKNGTRQPGGRVTISVGVASLPEDATSLEKLVDAADSALYASKRGGRNLSTAFQPGMEFHPGRERGPYAKKKKKKDEAHAEQRKLPIPEVATPASSEAPNADPPPADRPEPISSEQQVATKAPN
jgi:diguanylate cyclase (GGDEF)-like protein